MSSFIRVLWSEISSQSACLATMNATVLLLIGAAVLATVGGSPKHRELRQAWRFPDEQSRQNLPLRPTNVARTTTTTRTPAPRQTAPASTTPQPQVFSTSTQPAGVIFQLKNCPCQAPPQFNPVCGSDGNTYVNRQKLVCAQRCGFDVREARMGSC